MPAPTATDHSTRRPARHPPERLCRFRRRVEKADRSLPPLSNPVTNPFDESVEAAIERYGRGPAIHHRAEIPVCPWCGTGQEGHELPGEKDCERCGKTFQVTRHVRVTFSTSKVGEEGS